MNRRQRRRKRTSEKIAEGKCRLLGWKKLVETSEGRESGMRNIDKQHTFIRPFKPGPYLLIRTSGWAMLLVEDLRIREKEKAR